MKIIGLVIVASASLAQARSYDYYDYQGIKNAIFDLQDRFPDIVQVEDAQSKWGLDHPPGNCGTSSRFEKCTQYIVRLGNRAVQDELTPEVYFSGALHGSERVGPNIVTELLILMAESYNDVGPEAGNPWIKRLVDTRSLYVTPMTNSQGYAYNQRQEYLTGDPTTSTSSQDPNRDFSYDAKDGCMRTITARTVNELARRHAFQIALTFHADVFFIGGMWGSEPWRDSSLGGDGPSPDDHSQMPIVNVMSSFAGSYRTGESAFRGRYPTNRLNDLITPVRGGMEDWAYAASWETQYAKSCPPDLRGSNEGDTDYKEYPESRTIYNEDQLRQINILVETGNRAPPASEFGTNEEVLKVEGKGNGHIPRNIRIGLFALDIVQPYIQMVNPESSESSCGSKQFPTSSNYRVPNTLRLSPGEQVTIGWDVGGGIHVDDTSLITGPWPSNLPSNADRSLPGFGLLPADQEELFSDYKLGSKMDGFTRWGGGKVGRKSGSSNVYDPDNDITYSGDESDFGKYPYLPLWKQCYTAPTEPGEYIVMVRAKVDLDWNDQQNGVVPNIRPQTHIANARSNSGWDRSPVRSHRVLGRTRWYSAPVKVIVEGSANRDDATKVHSSTIQIGLGVSAGVVGLVGVGAAFIVARRRKNATKAITAALNAVGTQSNMQVEEVMDGKQDKHETIV